MIVKLDGTVTLTEEALHSFRTSPWANDITLQELTEFIPRTTDPEHGQGTKVMSKIMRSLELLRATEVFNRLESLYCREVFLSSGGP